MMPVWRKATWNLSYYYYVVLNLFRHLFPVAGQRLIYRRSPTPPCPAVRHSYSRHRRTVLRRPERSASTTNTVDGRGCGRTRPKTPRQRWGLLASNVRYLPPVTKPGNVARTNRYSAGNRSVDLRERCENKAKIFFTLVLQYNPFSTILIQIWVGSNIFNYKYYKILLNFLVCFILSHFIFQFQMHFYKIDFWFN